MLLDIIDTATAESAAEGYSRIALGVEYKGARYRGWQRQASGVPSVQQALEQALSKVPILQAYVCGKRRFNVFFSPQPPPRRILNFSSNVCTRTNVCI